MRELEHKNPDELMTSPKHSQWQNMMSSILGSGAGGKLIAWTLGKKGMKVGVVERKYVGGSCPNIACLPSKNVIHSAKVTASVFFPKRRIWHH